MSTPGGVRSDPHLGAGAEPDAGNYRPDIDGLRAIAVLAVIFYHARLPGFSGGFIGVDVFFVISGFLIGSILLREARSGTFSLAAFYERRVRRIAPALTLILLASTFVASVVLLPGDLRRFAVSLVWTLGLGSNVYFWMRADYFDVLAETKPLLHTWSLAIEEQYYLIAPVGLAWICRRWPRSVTRILAGSAIASFVLCVVATPVAPQAAFYFLPLRAWELLLGAVVASGPPRPRHPAARGGAAILGLAAVVGSAALFDARTAFPGMAALLPVGGSALLIAAHRAGPTFVARLLSAGPLVAIGRISYSLYLWHWPVFVFYRYFTDRSPEGASLAAVLTAVGLLSWLSWRFAEQPFRRTRDRIAYRTVLIGWLTISALLVVYGVVGHFSGGYAFLQRAEVKELAAGEDDRNPDASRCFNHTPDAARRGELCAIGPATSRPDFVLWGDSHADMLMPVFKRVAEQSQQSGLVATSTGCVPLVGVSRKYRSDACAAFSDAVLAFVAERHVPNVVLASYWSVYAEGWEVRVPEPQPFLRDTTGERSQDASPHEVFSGGLRRTVAALQAAGSRVFIVEQVPSQERTVPTWAAKTARVGGDVTLLGRPLTDHRERQRFVTSVFDELPGVRRVDPAALLCSSRLCGVVEGSHSLYADYNHLSTYGALRLETQIEEMMRGMLSR